tara:strand:- start:189 stop:362 length:174 start_codon:yes stop_codon:yes gene_type:complete
MIKIIRNENFPQFLKIIAFDNFVEEIQSKNKAIRIAKKIAKDNNINFIYCLGDVVPS